MNTYTVTFNGRTFTRKTDRTYTHAAFNADRKGNRGWVSFHGTYSAACLAAGRTGEVKPVTYSGAKPHTSCIVCNGDKVVTEQRADGTKHTVPCWKCNR
jgi:hypothetical protein